MIIGKEKLENCVVEVVDFVHALERDFGAVTVTSGYRAPDANAQAGGVKNSQHVLGKAVDVVVMGQHPFIIAAEAVKYGARGIGVDIFKQYCHVDFGDRPRVTTWVYGRDGKQI